MYDAVVVGAGPGGATAAATMARAGLQVLLIDKAKEFPRDKICGDALSGNTVDVMKRLGMIDTLKNLGTIPSWGVTFSSPSGDEVSIPFTKDMDRPIAPGYVCERTTFDALVLDVARESGAEIRLGTTLKGLIKDGDVVQGVIVESNGVEESIPARVTVGADGAYSAVLKNLGMDQLNEEYYSAGLRWYWSGVTGFTEGNHIELHFIKDAIPGYFWIFPLADGRANVGVGMLSSEVKKQSIKLKPLLEEMIQHPKFRDRFANATPEDKIRGWGLPLGSKPRKMHGDGWMLIGDAASLIDPFTGEGIANAMVSGECAARWTERAAESNYASAAFLKGYEDEVLNYLGKELKISTTLQRVTKVQWMMNLVIRKASRSPEVADIISSMFDDENQRRKLYSPLFYLRLLFA